MQFLRPILSMLLVALVFSGSIADAQSKPPAPINTSNPPRGYKNLDLVTQNRPKMRLHCRVVSEDDDKVVCKQAFVQTKTYPRSELIAVIAPGENEDREIALWWSFWFPATGACIYGAIVAASIAATAGLSVLAFIAFDFAFVGLMAVGDGPEDTIVYQKPGTKLDPALHLRLI